MSLAAWAESDALPWLWLELAAVLPNGRAKALKQTHDSIRQGLRVSLKDRKEMPLKANFYLAQLTMFETELRLYCDAIKGSSPQPWFAEDAKIVTLHGAITRFLNYAIILIDEASLHLRDNQRYGTGANDRDHSFQIYKGAEQVIYGRYSGLTHDDHAPYVAIAILRTSIEIRLRRAFGVQGLVNPTTGNFRPIDISHLFDAIKPYQSQIQFAVNFDDVMKIYRWSNFYLHGGRRDFPWVAGAALQYLRPLLSGTNTPTWSIDNGITMPRAVWRDIRSALDPAPVDRQELLAEIWKNLRAIFKRRRPKGWILNPADENDAGCVFRD